MWLAEFADLYAAGAALRMTPRDVDDLEMWEFAAALGEHRPIDRVASPRQQARGQQRPRRAARDLVAERLAHAQGRAPAPQPDRPSPLDPRLADLIPIRGRTA